MNQLQHPWQSWLGRRSRRWVLAILWTTLSLVMLFGIMPAAIAQDAVKAASVTILISAQELPYWKPIIAKFEAENADLRINVIEGPTATNAVEDLYTSAFLLGDSPYDLVYMDIVWVPKFAAAGWLLPLDDRVSPRDRSSFLAADLAGGTYKDRLYRLPVRSDAGLLYYRKDLLSDAGIKPPETVAELMEAAKQLQKAGKVKWGYAWQGRQYEGLAAMFTEILQGFGGSWVDAETLEVGLDQPEAIAALQFLIDTVAQGVSPAGVTTYQEEETRRLFESGDLLFLRNWPYVWPLANATDSKVAGKVGLKPMVYAPRYRSGACQGGWGWGISRTTQDADAAWRVANFFANADSQKQLSLSAGYLPARRSLYQDPEITAKYPYFPDMLPILDAAVLRPPIAQYAQASDILQRYLSAALTQRMDARDALRAAAAETRQLFST